MRSESENLTDSKAPPCERLWMHLLYGLRHYGEKGDNPTQHVKNGGPAPIDLLGSNSGV